jgi:glucose-6-phosphate 1-epimerase
MTSTKSGGHSQEPNLGRVSFLDGQGELPMLEITTRWSTAEIYLHGAHVTRFKKKDEPDLLFVSQCSRFTEEQPIRGGIPIIFPWFGMREGLGQHGFARVKKWELKEFVPAADGSVSIRFQLPDCPEASTLPTFAAEYLVTVSDSLALELQVTNKSLEDDFTFEACLHPYFEVGDVTAIRITGLKGVEYLDKVANFSRRTDMLPEVKVASEVDRIYLDTESPVELVDPRLGRKIRLEKHASASTIVWNPWIAKSQQMPDFGTDEYQRMVCIEPGNVASNQISLPPGKTSTMKVILSSEPLP